MFWPGQMPDADMTGTLNQEVANKSNRALQTKRRSSFFNQTILPTSNLVVAPANHDIVGVANHPASVERLFDVGAYAGRLGGRVPAPGVKRQTLAVCIAVCLAPGRDGCHKSGICGGAIRHRI